MEVGVGALSRSISSIERINKSLHRLKHDSITVEWGREQNRTEQRTENHETTNRAIDWPGHGYNLQMMAVAAYAVACLGEHGMLHIYSITIPILVGRVC